jgi:hypothetical protein
MRMDHRRRLTDSGNVDRKIPARKEARDDCAFARELRRRTSIGDASDATDDDGDAAIASNDRDKPDGDGDDTSYDRFVGNDDEWCNVCGGGVDGAARKLNSGDADGDDDDDELLFRSSANARRCNNRRTAGRPGDPGVPLPTDTPAPRAPFLPFNRRVPFSGESNRSGENSPPLLAAAIAVAFAISSSSLSLSSLLSSLLADDGATDAAVSVRLCE